MPSDGGAYLRLTAAGDVTHAGAGGGAVLHTVTCNTPASAALLKIYDGTSTTGTLVASIDGSPSNARSQTTAIFDIRCNRGVYAVQTGASADWTISVL